MIDLSLNLAGIFNKYFQEPRNVSYTMALEYKKALADFPEASGSFYRCLKTNRQRR